MARERVHSRGPFRSVAWDSASEPNCTISTTASSASYLPGSAHRLPLPGNESAVDTSAEGLPDREDPRGWGFPWQPCFPQQPLPPGLFAALTPQLPQTPAVPAAFSPSAFHWHITYFSKMRVRVSTPPFYTYGPQKQGQGSVFVFFTDGSTEPRFGPSM